MLELGRTRHTADDSEAGVFSVSWHRAVTASRRYVALQCHSTAVSRCSERRSPSDEAVRVTMSVTLRDLRDLRDLRNLRDLGDLRDLHDLRDQHDPYDRRTSPLGWSFRAISPHQPPSGVFSAARFAAERHECSRAACHANERVGFHAGHVSP